VKKQGAPEPIAALNKIKIIETHEPLVYLPHACPGIALREDKLIPWIRMSVADMLNLAQNSLPQGVVLQVHTALRTLEMQKCGWDGFFKKMKEEHPEWPLSTLRRATNQYFAPYDQPAPPGHCTGGAVDVSLIGPSGEVLDMISPTEGWQAAYTWSELISPEARRNRMMMAEAMLGAGFSNCRDEFWHYSWGDSAWAVRTGAKECPYGWIDPPEEYQI
jgi:D-alanyl-D-alanine dipeptidase